jgi:hypothetical protein
VFLRFRAITQRQEFRFVTALRQQNRSSIVSGPGGEMSSPGGDGQNNFSEKIGRDPPWAIARWIDY